MEDYDISDIDEVITEWLSSNFEAIDTNGIEFEEVVKSEDNTAFDFVFKVAQDRLHFKFEMGSYFFEPDDANQEHPLVEEFNDVIAEIGVERDITSEPPSEAVVFLLDKALLNVLEAKRSKCKQDGDTEMEIPDERDDGFDEGEDMDEDAWLQDDDDIEEVKMDKKSSTLDEQMNKYNIRLGSKDSIRIFRNLKVTRQAFAAKDLICKKLEDYPEVFQVQMFEPLLMFKLAIDLNFMTTEPHIYQSLGFDMQELVEFLFMFDDNKLLMFYNDDSIYDKELEELCQLGVLKIEFIQQCNDLETNRYQNYLQLLHETFFNKRSDGTSIAEEIKNMDEQDLQASQAKLLEMGFGFEETEEALKSSKFSVSGAINFLLGRKSSGKSKLKTSELADQDLGVFDPKHILYSNMTGMELKENPILNYFRFMLYSLDSITSYCCICRDQLPTASSKIKCCSKELCEFAFEEAQGIYITPEIRNDTESFTLDLSIFSECVMGGRVTKTFEPFPTFFLKDKELRSKRGYLDNIKEAREKGTEAKDVKESNKDIKTIRELFKHIPSVEKCLAKCVDDQVFVQTLEKQTKDLKKANDIYKLLRYLCCTNRVNFKHLTGDRSISGDSSIMEFLIYNHEAEQEKTFQKLKQEHGSIFTFHGSSIENWYSILRNGPRNLSNTKMMTAGAAYGAGVYSAKAFATASGYCGYRSYGYNNTATGLGTASGWKHSIVKQRCVIGILEIVKKSSYNKSGDYDIVVCPDDHCIMLRYIWVFNQGGNTFGSSAKASSTACEFTTKYYEEVKKIKEEKLEERKIRLQEAYERSKKRQEEEKLIQEKLAQQLSDRDKQEESKKYDDKIEKLEQKFTGKGTTTATKRILKEYKHFQTNADLENFEIKFKGGDNFYVWTLVLDILKFELTPDLKADLEYVKEKQSKDPTLEFEITFPSSFPFDPPFIRVVKPIFKFHTGHVTIGGSLCMESLTPSGWSSARSIEGLFVEILSIILQGEARIEKDRIGHTYSLQEARAAFDRVARHHGWL